MTQEKCVHCKELLLPLGTVIEGEWSHWHGDSYCHDRNGFCATPLRKAQPPYHPTGAVL